MVIDARNKLKPEHIAQFAQSIDKDDDIMITIRDDRVFVSSKSKFLSEILELMLDENVEVECKHNDTSLLITGMDINWWKQSARRYNKLFRAIEEQKIELIKTYKVGVATLSEGVLSQIKTFEGDKKSVIQFFNEEIRTRYLDEFLKMNVVFDLAYVKGDENDISQWLSLDELQEIGAISL